MLSVCDRAHVVTKATLVLLAKGEFSDAASIADIAVAILIRCHNRVRRVMVVDAIVLLKRRWHRYAILRNFEALRAILLFKESLGQGW